MCPSGCLWLQVCKNIRSSCGRQLGQPLADLLSLDDMVQVLPNMYGAKDTTSSIQTKTEHLRPKDENSTATFIPFRAVKL